MLWIVLLLVVVYLSAGHVTWMAWVAQEPDHRNDVFARVWGILFWFPLYVYALAMAVKEERAERR